MVQLGIIIGFAGVLLIMAGLVGRGFRFSGSVLPPVGPAARVSCFVVGGVLLLLSLGLVFADVPGSSTASNRPPPTITPQLISSTSTSPPAMQVTPAVGEVQVPVNIYQSPYLDSTVVGHLEAGAIIEILCTARGDAVTHVASGMTSNLWNGVSGGYVPDVVVYTGTNEATMGNC